jgi:hypothetical protein
VNASDLYDRLDDAFSAITPAPAPVDAAIRRGKRIRWRRRAITAVSVTATVAAAAVVPLAIHTSGTPAPAGGSFTVKVLPPGPHAEPGLIAIGTIDGKAWQFSVARPGTDVVKSYYQRLTASGPGFGSRQVTSVVKLSVDGLEPAHFDAIWNQRAIIQFAAVRGDVTRVLVRLTNGTRLTLLPVAAFGARLVAFGAPRGAVITSVTAYSAAGEIGIAVPYTFGDGVPTFASWLKPGQRGLSRGDATFSGVFQAKVWRLTAYTGPWGVCVTVTAGGSCLPMSETLPLGTQLLGSIAVPGNRQLIFGSAAAPVAKIIVTLDNRTMIPVTLTVVGGQQFFAFSTGNETNPFDWVAYDAAGHRVASGQY